jgi:hypothetical protein
VSCVVSFPASWSNNLANVNLLPEVFSNLPCFLSQAGATYFPATRTLTAIFTNKCPVQYAGNNVGIQWVGFLKANTAVTTTRRA